MPIAFASRLLPVALTVLAACGGLAEGPEPAASQPAPAAADAEPRPTTLELPDPPAPAVPEAPFAEQPAPTHYMGREIARTMHWTGAAWLLRETRENEEQASLLFPALAVEPGQTVADLGCGNGFHTLPLAELVGPTGRVLAIDLQPEMLTMLAERVAAAGLANVETVLAGEDDPHLEPGSCDLILLVDVYHELGRPERVLGHLRRALAPGGRLVLVEFREEDPEVPIKPLHKMSKAQVTRELEANGFRAAGSFDELPWQHVLTFEVAR